MYDNNSRGISYMAGFFLLIGFAIAGLVLASFISAPIWSQMTGLSFAEMQKNMSNPAYADTFKILQVITAVFGFFIPAVGVATLLNRKPFELLGYSNGVTLQQIGLVILIVGASLAVATGLSYVNANIPISEALRTRFIKMEDDYNRQVEAIVQLKNTKDYVIALVVMGFLPALCEETLFRGGLQNFLSRSTQLPWLSIVIVSIIFSVVHLSFFGLLSRLFLGIVLGALYQYSGKLWLSILAHFINNALALTVLFFYIRQGKTMHEAMKSDEASFWGIVALPVVLVLFGLFRKASGNRRLA
ncbi:MAG: CPBP family intramembrane glutamic endopeptidase [Chitinophagaceae bacterium]